MSQNKIKIANNNSIKIRIYYIINAKSNTYLEILKIFILLQFSQLAFRPATSLSALPESEKSTTTYLTVNMNAPDRFELFILPDGVEKYVNKSLLIT